VALKDSNRTTLAEPLATAVATAADTLPIVAAISTDGSSRRTDGASGESAKELGEVCDRATLDDLRAEGEDIFPELVGIFQSELTKGLDELNRALAARDCIVAARVAHTLKGTAGTFGAAQMQEMAARIDQLARAGRAEEAAAMFDEFRSECERVRRYLAAEVRT